MTAHDRTTTWKPAQDEHNYRRCDFCGSMNPEDLLGFIDRGEVRRVEMADRKYGYLHKLYLDVPNPLVGQPRAYGSTSSLRDGVRVEEPIIHPAPAFTHGKFYTRHLLDLPDDKFVKLIRWIEQATGYRFYKQMGELRWQGFVNRRYGVVEGS